VACDPYDDVRGGTPQIASVTAADVGGGRGVPGTRDATTGAWTVDMNCANLCEVYNDKTTPDDNDLFGSEYTDLTEIIVWVTFDRQINGNAVQTALDDCTPAGGWLTAEPAAPSGESWFSCYAPSSAQPTEGGSAVLFTAATPAAGAHVTNWGDNFTAPPAGQMRFTGNVAGRDIDVTVNRIDPTPGSCDCTPYDDPPPPPAP
jgi:hypothetical protein